MKIIGLKVSPTVYVTAEVYEQCNGFQVATKKRQSSHTLLVFAVKLSLSVAMKRIWVELENDAFQVRNYQIRFRVRFFFTHTLLKKIMISFIIIQ